MKFLAVVMVVFGAACGEQAVAVEVVEQPVYDCNAPAQRLTCAAPANPDERFVCHATSSSASPYDKIAVPSGSTSYVPGVSHNAGKPADQAPGASADDTGRVALDCECAPRVCADACTGGPDGESCGPSAQCADEVCTAVEIVINEVESSGGSPGDWVELYNAGTTSA